MQPSPELRIAHAGEWDASGQKGSLNGTSALSVIMAGAIGRLRDLASVANDMPADQSFRQSIETALALIAASNYPILAPVP